MSAVLPVITSGCKSLVSVSFESDLHLERVKTKAFAGSAIAHIFATPEKVATAPEKIPCAATGDSISKDT
jgi:hypothetical protein